MFNWFGKSDKDKAADAPEKKESRFGKLKQALGMTGDSLVGKIINTVKSDGLTEDTIDDIEETLLRADVGLDTAVYICDKLRKEKKNLTYTEAVMSFIRQEFAAILTPHEAANEINISDNQLNIILVVGVNGAGKTTFIGKIAHRLIHSGKKVVIGAGDTFRAAAEDQLAVWAERAGADLIRQDGADPASVIFDAIEHAKNNNADVVLLDTAGRLQNKFNLMEELKKIRGVIDKARPEASTLEALLVLDATTGQNGLKQAEVFKEAVNLSGVVLTKLDGSAKGGIVFAIARDYNLPVKMIGVGESIEDLRDFSGPEFIDALFADSTLLKQAEDEVHV